MSNGMRSAIVSMAEIVSSMLRDSKQEFRKMSSQITAGPRDTCSRSAAIIAICKKSGVSVSELRSGSRRGELQKNSIDKIKLFVVNGLRLAPDERARV